MFESWCLELKIPVSLRLCGNSLRVACSRENQGCPRWQLVLVSKHKWPTNGHRSAARGLCTVKIWPHWKEQSWTAALESFEASCPRPQADVCPGESGGILRRRWFDAHSCVHSVGGWRGQRSHPPRREGTELLHGLSATLLLLVLHSSSQAGNLAACADTAVTFPLPMALALHGFIWRPDVLYQYWVSRDGAAT